MVKEKKNTYRLRTAFIRLASVLLLVTMTVMLASPVCVRCKTEKSRKGRAYT